MNRKWIIYFLIAILLFSLFFNLFIQPKNEGLSLQNATLISNSLAPLAQLINATNNILNPLFNQIKNLPLSNPSVYSNIMNATDPPLLIYQNIMNQITKDQKSTGTTKSDASLVNATITSFTDPANSSTVVSKSVLDTNTAITNAFSTIVNANIQDNDYLKVLNDPKSLPITKYNTFMTMINNKQNMPPL